MMPLWSIKLGKMDISQFPLDIDYAIGVNFDYLYLGKFYAVNHRYARLYIDPIFWELKIIHDFDISLPHLHQIYRLVISHPGIIKEREAYLKIAGDREIPIPGAEKYGNPGYLTRSAVVQLINSGSDNINLLSRFFGISKDTEVFRLIGNYGRIDIIQKIIIRYPEHRLDILNDAMIGAAEEGNTPLVKLLMHMGANNFYGAFNFSLASKNFETINFLLEQPRIDINEALSIAACLNDFVMVNFLISRGANNYNQALAGAAFSGSYQIVDAALAWGATNLDGALIEAAEAGQLPMVKYLMDKGATDVNDALISAASRGHISVSKFLVAQGADNFDEALDLAPCTDNVEMVKCLMEWGATNFSGALETAAMEGSLEIYKFLFTYASKSDISRDLIIAKERYNTKITDFIILNSPWEIYSCTK